MGKEPPARIKQLVMREFDHLCAICGEKRPQVHHIDKNPANNDRLNLIPLCPNCHHNKIHHPDKPIPIGQMRLYRQHKHPLILSARFDPIFKRLQFLELITDDTNARDVEKNVFDLVAILKMQPQGEYYSRQVYKLLGRIPETMIHPRVRSQMNKNEMLIAFSKNNSKSGENYKLHVQNSRNKVYDLIAEMLHQFPNDIS